METDTGNGVQPAETPAEGAEVQGQGTETYQGLYDLSAAPEQLRPLLEAELKKVDANVTRRFQEHSAFREKWEPYESVEGLNEVPVEHLSQLLELRQVMSDPEAFESWWNKVGDDFGYFDGGTPDGAGPEAATGEGENPQLSQLMETVQSLAERLEQFESQGQEKEALEGARVEIDRQLADLEEKHGEFDKTLVLRLARDYVDEPDAIQRGFDDYQRITGQAQSELVTDKLDQPEPANHGGLPDTTADAPKTFKEAQAAALARLGG